MDTKHDNQGRLLLHACCGPCSLEPSRILSEQGHDFDIFYSNSNIGPKSEYAHRLETIKEWASSEGLSLIEDDYSHDDWVEECRKPFQEGLIDREERCRRCYRIRFERCAQFAKESGYGAICTTLSVSPYQYTDVIREELERASEDAGIECVFEDFRPYYDEATRRSREAGMYRQNYCGCELSAKEAELEREERRALREKARALKREQNAEKEELERAEAARRKEERRLYDEERSRRRRILKELKAKDRDDASPR